LRINEFTPYSQSRRQKTTDHKIKRQAECIVAMSSLAADAIGSSRTTAAAARHFCDAS
jgi:hypothetical protein